MASNPRARAQMLSPFARLNRLLDGIEPGASAISLTVGEPREGMPGFVGAVLAEHVAGFGKYPAIVGLPDFRAAVGDWLDRRYRLAGSLAETGTLIPLNGSREGLFFAAVAAADHFSATGGTPLIMLPNPFYQAYLAGVRVAGTESMLLEAGPAENHLPDPGRLDPSDLDRAVAVYLASPANPQGAVFSLGGWGEWIEAARRHDFLLIADECYSEIYRDAPPVGVLEAAHALGEGYANVVAFNSLSKRSSMPGLRCGFAAGDKAFIDRWAAFRNMAAPQVPEPLQRVAIAAYRDEEHVAWNRDRYNEKYRAAGRILGDRFGYVEPAGGFFLWLDVGDYGGGEAVARRLWEDCGVRAVPGGYLAGDAPDGGNSGAPFIRLAMVEDLETTETALRRMVAVLGNGPE